MKKPTTRLTPPAFLLALTASLLLVLISGCSTGDSNKDKISGGINHEQKLDTKTGSPAAAPEALTGREAFQKLYVTARLWAVDSKPVRLQSEYNKDAGSKPGEAGIWRATFVSASRKSIKGFAWSGITGKDLPERGVSHGSEDTYNPGNASTQPFDASFLKVDSDKAFAVAQAHGGAKLLKAHPDTPVLFILDWDPRKLSLSWHVVYGGSPIEAKLRVAVNASTADFIMVEK